VQEFSSIYDNNEGYPPVAFYFQVSFPGSSDIKDTSFKEVSGISSEMELESINEGGENRFTHKLPKNLKHGNLILKRGVTSPKGKLIKWVKDSIDGDFSKAFITKQIMISLLNSKAEPINSWTFNNALPVKLEVSGFDSEKSQVAIESIEFSYTNVIRS
jgi:phage tail-like protein